MKKLNHNYAPNVGIALVLLWVGGMKFTEYEAIAVSGSGNVAIYAAEKALTLGAKVVTLSDSDGFIYDEAGIDQERLEVIKTIKEIDRERISKYLDHYPEAEFHQGQRPWSVAAEIAMPCATQNELNLDEAKELVSHGVIAVAEGANMPTEAEAIEYFLENKVHFAPAKAANAGGVAVSGLEQSQNSLRVSWSKEEVDDRLQAIMKDIHQKCVEHGREGENDRYVNYLKGANVAGFIKVADAMLAYGAV